MLNVEQGRLPSAHREEDNASEDALLGKGLSAGAAVGRERPPSPGKGRKRVVMPVSR